MQRNKPTITYFLPNPVLYLRIHFSVKQFYEDLQVYCKTMGWKYTKPKKLSTEKEEIHYQNNMVKIDLRNKKNGRPERFLVTYNIPTTIRISDTGRVWKIQTKGNQFEIVLNKNYPASISSTKVYAITKYFNPRWSDSRPCYSINGEIDKILMNQFQQLLWIEMDLLDRGGSVKEWDKNIKQMLQEEMNKKFKKK